jgi:predicted dinucleotide-binding enzyme
MRIAVLGTGMVGRALAGKLAELGHDVTVGTRDVADTMARREPDMMGNPPFSAWAAAHPQLRVADFAEAAGDAEMIVNATAGAASMEVLTAAGERNLAGKVLLDVSNPLDFSSGMPPTLFVVNSDSLAERIQRAFPTARVVKALNTMTAYLMVDPKQLAGGDHTTFVAGDDDEAKATVTRLLESFGHADVVDLGDLSAARAAEMVLPIWLRLFGKLGTPIFGFKVVR